MKIRTTILLTALIALAAIAAGVRAALTLSLVPEGYPQDPIVIGPDGVAVFSVRAASDVPYPLGTIGFGILNEGGAGNVGPVLLSSAFGAGSRPGTVYGDYGSYSVQGVLAHAAPAIEIDPDPYGRIVPGVVIGIVQFRASGLSRTGENTLTLIPDDPSIPQAQSHVTVATLGDANLDGTIDAADFAAIDHGRDAGLGGWANGDFNGDGYVSDADYQILNRAYAAQLALPEPSSLMLGLPAILVRARKR